MKRAAPAGVLLMCAMALGQPAGPDPRLVTDLQALERSAASRALSLREREAAADQAIDLRRRLIEAAPASDARLPDWLIDQSAALLARPGRDGADTAVLFGIPSENQRASTHSHAKEAAEHLQRALSLIGSRREGAEEDRAVRIDFLRSRAHVLLAALASGQDRMRHSEAALAAIGKVGFTSPGAEAIRRVNTGAALLMKSSPPAVSDAQLAVEEFAWAALGGETPDQPAQEISRATRAEGWFGLAHAAGALGNAGAAVDRLRQAMGAEPFISGGRPDALLAVLASDAITRVLFEQGLARSDRGMLESAAAEQMALIARTDLGFRGDALRPAAFDKLASLSDRAPAPAQLPAAFALAAAIRDARDAGRRADAVAAFEAIAVRPDAGPSAVDALWESAVLLLQGDAEQSLRGVANLVRIARDFPEHPRAGEAMAAALSYARHLGGVGEEAGAAYRDALILATERYLDLPEIDLWRYERARLALAQAAPEPELHASLTGLRQIAEPTADAVRLTELLQVARLERLRQRHREALNRAAPGDAAKAREIAARELEPEARAAFAWARQHQSGLAPRFEADLADAMTDAGRPDGRIIYQELLKRSAETIPGGRPRLTLGLARSLLNADRPSEAFAHLRDVAAALDAAPADSGGPARTDDFWHAWALLLETLAAEGSSQQEKAGAIRAHIRRLESIDPQLGGPPWRQRINAVRDQVR